MIVAIPTETMILLALLLLIGLDWAMPQPNHNPIEVIHEGSAKTMSESSHWWHSFSGDEDSNDKPVTTTVSIKNGRPRRVRSTEHEHFQRLTQEDNPAENMSILVGIDHIPSPLMTTNENESNIDETVWFDMTSMGVYPCPGISDAFGFLEWNDLITAVNDAGSMNNIFMLCPNDFYASSSQTLHLRRNHVEIGCVTAQRGDCRIHNATVAVAESLSNIVLAGLEWIQQATELLIGWDASVHFIACSFRRFGNGRAPVVTGGADVSFSSCHFQDNQGGQAGAVFIAGGMTQLKNCLFQNLQALSVDTALAAAILVCAVNDTVYADLSLSNSCFGGDQTFSNNLVYVYNVPYSRVVINRNNVIATSGNESSMNTNKCHGIATHHNATLRKCSSFIETSTSCAVHMGFVTAAPSSSMAPTLKGDESETANPSIEFEDDNNTEKNNTNTLEPTYIIDSTADPSFSPVQPLSIEEPARVNDKSRKDAQPPLSSLSTRAPLVLTLSADRGYDGLTEVDSACVTQMSWSTFFITVSMILSSFFL